MCTEVVERIPKHVDEQGNRTMHMVWSPLYEKSIYLYMLIYVYNFGERRLEGCTPDCQL